MNRFESGPRSRWSLPSRIGMALVAVTVFMTAVVAVTAEAKSKSAGKVTDGAQLYAIHCNRCHSERYATERTDAQWQTILMHMRVRAQIPADDAMAIMKYLQDNN